MATDFHAEHVGSLLRQPWLLDARARHQRGELDEAGLRAAEDRAAGENIALQRAGGHRDLHRRRGPADELDDRHPGVDRRDEPRSGRPPVNWHRDDGEIPPDEETDFVLTAASAQGVPEGQAHRRRGGVHGQPGARPVQDHDDERGDGRAWSGGPRSARAPTPTPWS